MLENLQKLQHDCNVVNSKAGRMWRVHLERISSLQPQHLQHWTAAWPLDFNLLYYRTVKWLPLLARTHPTWSSFGEFLIWSLGWEHLIERAVWPVVGQCPSAEDHWANTFRLHVRRKQAIPHLLDDSLKHKDLRHQAAKRKPEVSTTSAKCGLLEAWHLTNLENFWPAGYVED